MINNYDFVTKFRTRSSNDKHNLTKKTWITASDIDQKISQWIKEKRSFQQFLASNFKHIYSDTSK